MVPDRNLGPLDAWNPYILWLVVLLITLTGGTGHFVARWFKERIGLPLAGLFSGFASNVATITAVAARVRRDHRPTDGVVAAALLSNVATLVQMLLPIAIINIDLLCVLAAPLVVSVIAAVTWSAFWIWRTNEPSQEVPESSVLSINQRVAIGFALQTATLLLIAAVAHTWFGAAAMVAVVVFEALADVHAVTVSIATQVVSYTLQAPTVGVLVMLALAANTFSKVVVTISGGCASAGKVTAGLLTMLLSSWAMFALVA